MPENIGIHISLLYEYLHFNLFALQSNIITWHVSIFQQSCIDHIHIQLKMEYVYFYQVKHEDNNTGTWRDSVDVHSLTDEKGILDQYNDVFTGLGCTEGGKHHTVGLILAFLLNWGKS